MRVKMVPRFGGKIASTIISYVPKTQIGKSIKARIIKRLIRR